MILSDKEIKKWLKEKKLTVEPLDKHQIQPASIDLRLGKSFLFLKDKGGLLDVKKAPQYIRTEKRSIILPAHSFVLATTEEYIKLPRDLTAFVEGRSSIGRLGVFVQNAGWVDPGFEGKITLELFNANSVPIKLRSGMRICQLVLARTTSEVSRPYRGKYQRQSDVLGSRIHLDAEWR